PVGVGHVGRIDDTVFDEGLRGGHVEVRAVDRLGGLDGTQPNAYLESLPIGLKAGQTVTAAGVEG
ncbi:MAG: hypothetical protein AAFO29_17280, partial [Actinomycetota bacterium]